MIIASFLDKKISLQKEIFLLLSWSESFRKCFTDDTIFIFIETIDIESFYLRGISSLIIWSDLIRTLIIFCLSLSLSLEVITVEVSFSFCRKSTWPHKFKSIFCMSDSRFLYTLSWPESAEIEIIIHRLDTDSCEDDDTESDSKTCFYDIEPPEDEEYYAEPYHEPDTCWLGITSFFSSSFEICCSLLEIRHRKEMKK